MAKITVEAAGQVDAKNSSRIITSGSVDKMYYLGATAAARWNFYTSCSWVKFCDFNNSTHPECDVIKLYYLCDRTHCMIV